jgi:hypothetical protein
VAITCDEFRFDDLEAKLSMLRRSPAFMQAPAMEDTEAQPQPSAREEWGLALLRSELSRLSQAQDSAGGVAAAGLGRLSLVQMAQMRPSRAAAPEQSGEV